MHRRKEARGSNAWPSMRLLVGCVLALGLLLLSARDSLAAPPTGELRLPVHAQASEKDASTEAIQSWVRDLSASEYSVRREAFLQLWQQGSTALPAVRNATTVSDQQTVSAARALELLLKFEITPKDNDELAELLQLSRSGLNRALVSLTQKGHWRLATELLRNNEATLAPFRDNLRPDALCTILQAATNQGEADKAWPVIQQLLKPAHRLWISVHAGAALNQPEEQLSNDERSLLLLFRGEADAAWALKPSLPIKQRIIFLSGRWEWLQDEAVKSRVLGINADTKIGRAQQAAYAYMAGDRQTSDQLLKTVHEDEEPDTPNEPAEQPAQPNPPPRAKRALGIDSLADRRNYELIMALLLCGDGESVNRLLLEQTTPQSLDYHVQRLEYEKALSDFGLDTELSNFDDWLKNAIAKLKLMPAQTNARGGSSDFKRYCGLASFLVALGRSDEGLQLYKKLIDHAQSVSLVAREQFWDELAQRTGQPQLRSRLIEQLDAQGSDVSAEVRERLLIKLYPDWAYVASSLWKFAPPELTQASDVPNATEKRWALIERLWRYDRGLISENANSRFLENWLTAAFRDAIRMEENATHVGSQMSEIALHLGLRNLALSFANSGTGRTPFADVAEVCMKSSQYEAATKWWDLAIRQEPRQHKWVLRNITACEMVGEDEKAESLEATRWMRPLTPDQQGESSYLSFAKNFHDEGDWLRAREYADAAFSLFDPNSQQILATADTYGQILRDLEDFQKFANVHRAANVTLLLNREDIYPVSTLQFFVSHEFLARSIAELDSGQVDAALDTIRRFESLRPAGIEICEFSYGRLIKLGRKAAADALLERCSGRMLGHLEQWPRDAGSHNNLAWLYARCDQRLDDALKHAELAVELSERAPTYLDTLAEAHFRLGHVAKAIELTKEAIAVDPRHAHYRKQLQRFRDAQ